MFARRRAILKIRKVLGDWHRYIPYDGAGKVHIDAGGLCDGKLSSTVGMYSKSQFRRLRGKLHDGTVYLAPVICHLSPRLYPHRIRPPHSAAGAPLRHQCVRLLPLAHGSGATQFDP